MRTTASALVVIACAALPLTALGDVAAGINRIRERGCDRKPGTSTPLRPSRRLDAVAREWSKGGRLHEAIARTDYQSVSSHSMRIEGARTEAAALEVLAKNYCATILDPQFTEIGSFERGRDAWIVVARPFLAPSQGDADRIGARVLELTNQARAKPRKCGSKQYPAVAKLKLSPLLTRAAMAHARDMNANNFLEHRGSDGSVPAVRVTRAGYQWQSVGENIAVGATDADAVVNGWLNSPGHCGNIMSADFSEMGLAYFVDGERRSGLYWVQVFATPRGS
jgi:uncharacterized protein YkwD